MTYKTVYWEDVVEGQALQGYEYELSLLRLVSFIRATGLYDFVHFDRDYAQAAGTRDVFISTPHVAGLLGRLLTDWSGPDAAIRSLNFRMQRQCCTNDILTVTGKIGRKYRSEDGEYLVDLVDLNIAHEIEPHAVVAYATMALPSREHGAVRAYRDQRSDKPIELDPNMPDFAKKNLGKIRAGGLSEWPLSKHELHWWCEALEDWNPLYWDEDYAKNSRYGTLVAPPTCMFFAPGTTTKLGIGYMKPGATIPPAVENGLTGLPLLQELRSGFIAGGQLLSPPDCPEIAVVNVRGDYYRPIRAGDFTRQEMTLLDCSPKKRTKLGEGYFVSSCTAMYNQDDELVSTFTRTVLHYHT